jgi:hypothetical protein
MMQNLLMGKAHLTLAKNKKGKTLLLPFWAFQPLGERLRGLSEWGKKLPNGRTDTQQTAASPVAPDRQNAGGCFWEYGQRFWRDDWHQTKRCRGFEKRSDTPAKGCVQIPLKYSKKGFLMGKMKIFLGGPDGMGTVFELNRAWFFSMPFC